MCNAAFASRSSMRPAAGGTDRRAHTQALAHALATPTALLRRVGRRDGFHALAGPGCRAGEEESEGISSGVVDGRVQASRRPGPGMEIAAVPVRRRLRPAAKVAYPHIFRGAHVVAAHQRARRRVGEGAPLALHLVMRVDACASRGAPPACGGACCPACAGPPDVGLWRVAVRLRESGGDSPAPRPGRR